MKIKERLNYIKEKAIIKTLEIKAKLLQKSFICNALAGDSYYNISINSDLGISCHCNDWKGVGKIGNLKKNKLIQIFNNKKTNMIRKNLANQKIPLINCCYCSDLKLTDKKTAKEYAKKFNTPNKGIMIENTNLCNLNCLSCQRKKINSLRKQHFFTNKDILRVAKTLKENKIKNVVFFTLGEPFLSKNIENELKTIRKYNQDISIVTSTNGMLIGKNKINAALLFNQIYFSIHGSDQKTAEKYQKNIDFNKSYNNMKKLADIIDSKKLKQPKIIWKYVLFNWNDSKKSVKQAIQLAKKTKIDKIIFEKTLYPTIGISLKYLLNLGYLNKIGKFRNKQLVIELK